MKGEDKIIWEPQTARAMNYREVEDYIASMTDEEIRDLLDKTVVYSKRKKKYTFSREDVCDEWWEYYAWWFNFSGKFARYYLKCFTEKHTAREIMNRALSKWIIDINKCPRN